VTVTVDVPNFVEGKPVVAAEAVGVPKFIFGKPLAEDGTAVATVGVATAAGAPRFTTGRPLDAVDAGAAVVVAGLAGMPNAILAPDAKALDVRF
jgi:hypothetical protein